MEKDMATEKCKNEKHTVVKHVNHGASGGAVYGFGLIGALIYFLQTAAGFWAGVLGILKALVWPAMIVYEVLKMLKL
ncbi:MAG: hypothetical protein WCJ36_01610 [Candidatus Saccharibacteria bacterium]